MVKNKKLFDEHEIIGNSDYRFEGKRTKKINIILSLLIIIIASLFVIYITKTTIQKRHERQQIDEIITSIQNEIFIKQCQLDKMYCCGYNEENSCKQWIEKGCTETDGTPTINCTSLLEKISKK